MKVQVLYQNIQCFLESLVAPQGHGRLPDAAKRAAALPNSPELVRSAQTELVRRYEKRLVNYVFRITHRYEEAHDLAQEIFVKVYLAIDRYDPKYQFSTWLFRIAQNASIDALRKKSIAEVSMARY